MLERDEKLVDQVKTEAIAKFGFDLIGTEEKRKKVPYRKALSIALWMR